MLLKVNPSGKGLHPSEMVVTVDTRTGEVEVVIDSKSLQNNYLQIGSPVDADGKYQLVELPRPTAQGQWRVWVDQHSLTVDKERNVRDSYRS